MLKVFKAELSSYGELAVLMGVDEFKLWVPQLQLMDAFPTTVSELLSI